MSDLGEDFGPQGGDPRRLAGRVGLDLSTCVNRYGPPPAALAALRALSGDDLVGHPYAAARRLEESYAAALGVPAEELVAGRGTTEFIWALGRQFLPATVSVPLPAYTDYLRVFPGRGFARFPGEPGPSLEQVEAALDRSSLVILSNPHNPTGVTLDPVGLVEVAARHPWATLVVDESYVDFLPDPDAGTVIGTDVDNVIALRSPSKFYGIAATRAGAAWCRDVTRLRRLFHRRDTWPVSGIDVAVASAALASNDWADESRLRLQQDARWLGQALRAVGPVTDVGVHYRYVVTEAYQELAVAFAEHGIGVRPLGRAHGVVPGALRIVAPRAEERSTVAAALAAVAGREWALQTVA